ncbi:hypothetical protein D3C85_1656170 [compost metagenome]
MKSMLSDVSAAPDLAADMTNVSRPSTNCSSKWTALAAMKALLLSRLPTAQTYLTRPCFVRDALTVKLQWIVRMSKAAKLYSRFIPAINR